MGIRKIIFKRFRKEHFEEYKSWFLHDAIKKTLYDIDDEWFDYVLNDKTGIEYVVYENEELVAVVGIKLPNKDNPRYVITNIAIKPSRFRQGLGSMVLKELIKLHSLKENESWSAFVEKHNMSAQFFFQKNGWVIDEGEKDEDDMIRYMYPPINLYD